VTDEPVQPGGDDGRGVRALPDDEAAATGEVSHDADLDDAGLDDAGLDEDAGSASGFWDETEPATGNNRVDEAVARLTELASLPTSEHADLYEDVHRRLHTALTDLDSD
jgi:hypothetical protein